MARKNKEQPYTIAGIEDFINAIISFIFYYRLFFVAVGLGLTSYVLYRTWQASAVENKFKNFAAVLTCGSIIIGIFYSILNYEYSQIRFKHDKKLSREILTFNIASEWYKPPMSDHMRIASKCFEKHKAIIDESHGKKFHEQLENPTSEEEKKALLAIFNYFESISLAIRQGIMDEDFIKGFFLTAFKQYFMQYSFYIEYRRKMKNNPKIWENFTILANNWLQC